MNHSFAFYCALMLIVRIIQEKCEYHKIPENHFNILRYSSIIRISMTNQYALNDHFSLNRSFFQVYV